MITDLDFVVLNFIRENIANPALDTVMKFITHAGDGGAIWIVTVLALLSFKKTRKAGLCLAISLVVTTVFGNLVLKNLFGRIRPFIAADVQIIINPPGGYSFPSGHTGSSFAAAAALSEFYKKWSVVFYIIAALIALSRVYLYVHYPTDILGGAVLGIFVGIAVCKAFEKVNIL